MTNNKYMAGRLRQEDPLWGPPLKVDAKQGSGGPCGAAMSRRWRNHSIIVKPVSARWALSRHRAIVPKFSSTGFQSPWIRTHDLRVEILRHYQWAISLLHSQNALRGGVWVANPKRSSIFYIICSLLYTYSINIFIYFMRVK